MDPAGNPRLRDRLVDSLLTALADYDPHRGTAASRLRQRVDFLVDAFQAALVAGDPAEFAHYVANLSIRRIGEGRFLEEMTVALAAIEATTWSLVVAEADPAAAIPRLRDLVRTVGAARDQLARSYRARARLSDREIDRLLAMFRGVAPRAGLQLRLSRLAPYFTMVCGSPDEGGGRRT
jgi:hypothetical protein